MKKTSVNFIDGMIINIIQNKNITKNSNDKNVIPDLKNYDILLNNKYSVSQLKVFAKKYELKSSGTKHELLSRIYTFLKLSGDAIKIQKLIRGKLVRFYFLLRGPAVKNRALCINDTDFLSGDKLNELNRLQFFSFTDNDGFIYGFDILSLYNLFNKTDKNTTIKNPYNRNVIPIKVINDIKQIVRMSKMLRIGIDINIEELVISNEKTLEFRIIELFQNINTLGNYADSNWFSTLNKVQYIKFMRELIDIWTYRAELTVETKRAICPPAGNLFININFIYLNTEHNLDNIKNYILLFLEKLVNSGIDTASKSLGAYYVLAALTLVNENAATTLPWLYHSVSHF